MFPRTVHRNGVTHGKHESQKLDDDEIVKLVDDNVRTSTGYTASDLSKEREKVLDYYNGNLPKPAHDGNSKYVSQDVYNAVQSMQAALLETFAAGNRIVKFAPQGQTMSSLLRSALHTQTSRYSEPMMATLYSRRLFQMHCSHE